MILSGLITGLFTLTLAHELKIRFGVEWRTVIDELMLSVCAVILNVQTHRSPRDERNDQQRGNSSFMVLSRAFTPVLAKHSNSFSLIDCVSVGVDRMQRNFEPMRKQLEASRRSELTDVTARWSSTRHS